MKPYGFARKPRLNLPLEERFKQGMLPVLEHIEAYGDDATFDAVVSCMNAAFDAGQVEVMRRKT